MARFYLFLSWLFLLALSTAQAQQTKVLIDTISTEKGLSNRFVRSIYQDSKGFIWAGTKIGLNRYDGYNFKVFNTRNSALQGDHINRIWEDADSNLWIGHGPNSGLFKPFREIDILNINTFKVQSLQAYLGDALPIAVEDIYGIHSQKGHKELYLTTTNGMVYIYKGKGVFEVFYDQRENVKIYDLYFDDQYTWICSDNQLVALNKKRQVIYKQRLHVPENRQVEFYRKLDSNTILISINDGSYSAQVWEWQAARHELILQQDHKFLGLPFGNPREENHAQDGFRLFCNIYTLKIYDNNDNILHQESFHKDPLYAIYVDQQKNIWLAIGSRGLTKISIGKKRFDTYLKGISTRAVIEHKKGKELLIGSYSGHCIVDMTTLEDTIATKGYTHVIEPSQFGHYWMADRPYVRKVNPNNLQIEQIYYYERTIEEQIGIQLLSIWALHEDSTGRLWVGFDNGLGYLDVGADSIKRYKVEKNYEALNSSIIYDFHKNKQGLWIATSLGLYLKKAGGKGWAVYNHSAAPPYHLPFDYLFDINEDRQGNLWLATQGGGVLCLQPNTGVCEQWTTQQGLSHNVTYATLEDAYGYIWISSNKGLMRMDPTTHLVNTYLPENGIPHEEFNRKSYYKGSNGRLYFGGLGGVISFDGKDFIDTTTFIPPLHLINYQYFDGNRGSLSDGTSRLLREKVIDLSYNDRFFILQMALLDFKINAPKTYAYQIEGLQDEWIFTTNPTIRVDGLRPGLYTLRVKAESSSGNWSPVLLELPILVRQPFYLQWPFIVVVLFLTLLFGFVYIKIREKRLQEAQLLLEKRVRKRTSVIEEQTTALRELDEMKTRFFANISHELRTPLTLILGPVEAALNKEEPQTPEEVQALLLLIRRHSLKLNQLVEEILSLSKLEANQLALEEHPRKLAAVLKSFWSNFEEQAALEGIHWVIDQEIPDDLIVLMDVDKLEKIINNLLSNALKYTPKGEHVGMSTRWDQATQCLYLNVNDTGKGIAPEDLPHIFKRFYQAKEGKATGGTGIGLALASELAQLMGGDIQAASILGTGSTFMLTVPFKALQKKEEPKEEVEDFVPPSLVSDSSATILIVEDLMDMRLFLSVLLSQYYNVKTAENGQQALLLLEENNNEVDLIISDVMMPVMDGFEFLEKLKNNPQRAQIPVIMLTARTAERDKLKALKIGVDDYLQKPFSNRELLARIENLLEHYQQLQYWDKQDKPASNEQQQETPKEAPLNSNVDSWVENLEKIVKREVGNTQFNITSLAYDLNLSERQLRRKIKAKTGLTPNQYFRGVKLDVARHLLETRRFETVSEVAHHVGFSNVHYFSKLYVAEYGRKPVDYLRS
jgi:signal transduction histidine kinase/DNA-binding response OmpR family regulator